MYKNKILVANPVITDPLFCQSVIFLFTHTSKGAEGVILNSSKEIGTVGFKEMSKFLEEMPPLDDFQKLMANLDSVPLYAGGPCKTPGLYFMHGYEEFHTLAGPQDEKPEFDLGIPASFGDNEYGDDPAQEIKSKLKVIDGVYFGTPVTFGQIVEAGKVKENKFRFYSGISIWGPGQLEREIAGGAWKIMDFKDPDLFFDIPALNKLAGKVETPVEEVHWQDTMGFKPYNPSLN